MTRADIVSVAERVPGGGIVIVDEAYGEFWDEGEDAVSLAMADGPVIVARTFSNASGMARLRLGYVLGSQADVREGHRGLWGDSD